MFAADGVTVDQLASLVSAQVFNELGSISISGQKLNDDHCAFLAKQTNLNALDVSGSSVTDAGIAMMAMLPSLETLNIAGTDVTVAGLRSLQASNNLKTLICAPKTWSVEFVEALLDLRTLTELSLPFSEMPHDVALAFASRSISSDPSNELYWFEGGPEFENQIYYMEEDVVWMAGITPFKANSEQLMLVGSLIDDAKIAEVISSPAVERVYVKNVHCDLGTLMSKLIACPNVKQISLSGVQLAPSEISKLSVLTKLEWLDLTNCELAIDHMAELAKLQSLSTLMIPCNGTEAMRLSELLKLKRLRKLILKTDGSCVECQEMRQRLGIRCEFIDSGRR